MANLKQFCLLFQIIKPSRFTPAQRMTSEPIPPPGTKPLKAYRINKRPIIMSTTKTAGEYKTAIVNRLRKDLQTAKGYLRTCQQYYKEATSQEDEETVYFWASQQDATLQQIEAINHHLKVY